VNIYPSYVFKTKYLENKKLKKNYDCMPLYCSLQATVGQKKILRIFFKKKFVSTWLAEIHCTCKRHSQKFGKKIEKNYDRMPTTVHSTVGHGEALPKPL
jgi:hypothetical protein